jgi:hypothetical protein
MVQTPKKRAKQPDGEWGNAVIFQRKKHWKNKGKEWGNAINREVEKVRENG